jgi:histidinol phosphatase-like enzyme (inositol monophosphatase family)
MAVGADLQAELWGTAGDLADIAAAHCMRLFRSPDLVAANKAATGFDPVTEGDRAAEKAMRQIIAERRPADGVDGEEFGRDTGSSGFTWVLDPIDGTRAFLSGAPTWGILIGLDGGEGPVLGVVDQPFTRERFMGGFGRAEYSRDGNVSHLRVRKCAALADAVLYTTRPEIGSAEELEGFAAVSRAARLTRYGLDCYAYALIALGHVDLVIEAGLHSYDIQGPQAVIEAAGGIVTDWRGRPAHQGGRVLAAGDRRIHAAALEILARVSD